MPVHNAEIAEILERVGDMLEIEGANAFRIRAYRNAARTVADLPRGVAGMVEAGEDLSELPAIGKDLAGKIAEIVETGHLAMLDEMQGKTPAGLVDMLGVPGLGPKRVHVLHDELGIDSLKGLAEAARAGRIRKLAGFGGKTEAKILRELETRGAGEHRVKRLFAEEVAGTLLEHLRAGKGIRQLTVAGSYRRCKETVGDLDILAACRRYSDVMDRFVGYDEVADIISHGTTRSTVVLRSGLQVDLRVVPEESYGAALHYFTGSKAHNIAVRRMGQDRGLKINEYGVFRGSRRIGGATEEEVYDSVGLPWIEPVLREHRGEIEAAQQDRLPGLVTVDDMRGDLHCHSKASDGHASIAEMAEAARARGYAYMSINDHSRRVTIAHGLDPRRVHQQTEEIDHLNESLKGFTILKSIEVDILEDGSLDLPDEVLDALDFTVCAVHSKFGLDRRRQTERIMRAMDNPRFTILAHPSGRLIGERQPADIDMERLLEAAAERGCLLEVNGQPDRLDLTDIHCKMAKEAGVKVAISTDAHSTGDLAFMRLGVDQARRGWLEPGDVVNTRNLSALRRLMKR